MHSAVDISYLNLLTITLFLILPLGVFYVLKIKLSKTLIIAAARMIIQLSFVGVYLKYIFAWNNLAINLIYIVLMLAIATVSVGQRSRLKLRFFFPVIFFSFCGSVILVFGIFSLVIDLQQLINARYIIPISGMLLGNILKVNVVCLSKFFTDLSKNENEYLHYLSLGASFSEARTPFIRNAYQAALSPQIAGLSTMGLVALPGMMTGQILGGSSPTLAIKYQILIMLGIFIIVSVSAYICMLLACRPAFNEYHILQKSKLLNKN